MFYEMKDWSVVYFDYDGLVLLKQTPQNKPIIDRFAIDLSKWEPKPFNLYKLGPRRIDPFVFTNRAYTLIALGLLEPAKKEALQALLVAPEWLASYRILGKIYGQQKDHRKAFEYLRIAVMFAPQDIEARSNLALAYEHLRYYKGALAQYQRMIEYAPHDPKGYFGVAKEYALAGQSLKAIEALKVAMKMDAKDKIDVKKIHDIIAKHKLSDELKKKLEDVAKPSIPTNSVK
jgi:tetratricopeptide (TPR) repeat protein